MQFSFFSPFYHHNIFPFQLSLFAFCASHFKICNIKDQLEMVCFELTSFLSAFPLLFPCPSVLWVFPHDSCSHGKNPLCYFQALKYN